jgi:ribosomal protein L24E
MRWLRKKHPKLTWKQLRRRSFAKDSIKAGTITLYIPASMRILRYRYRGAQTAPRGTKQPRSPRWTQQTDHQR